MSDYRFYLWRRVGVYAVEPTCLTFVMLNPSTADDTDDDPTIRRCKHFATREGFGSLTVVNLFPLRATDPEDLWKSPDRNLHNHENDKRIREAMHASEATVFAWGADKRAVARGREVLALAHGLGIKPQCLGTSKDGHPRHPLYLKNDAPLRPWPLEVA